jgi:ATP-binding cassette subfamily F protein 3
MILIDINNLTVAFGEREILTSVTLQIQKGQCIGLTGLNGAGKTTLMKTVAGIYESTSGSISIQKGIKIGYLEQQHTASGIHTVLEEATKSFEPLFLVEERMHRIEEEMTKDGADITLLGERYEIAQREFDEAGGYGWKSRLTGVLKGLGLTEEFWDKPVDVLSGGEKTRLALARMLLDNNDVLLLDEPTNHLDLQAAEWLTDYLSRFSGTVLLISHDRYMMDKLCDGVAQIENGRLQYYRGNYTEYTRKWEEQLKANQHLYERQQDEIKRQRAIIARYRQFNREKSIRAAESREKVLNKMELIEAPEKHNDMRLNFKMDRVSGGDVLKIRSLSMGFEDKTLFNDFSYEVKQGERIVIIGPNGAGKTTLMEILLNKRRAKMGEVIKGVNVDLGYYEQGQREFMGGDTVMDMVWWGNRDLTQTEVRSCCAAMLFFGEDVFKTGNVLSGGERARVALAKLSVSGSNTLILDEPTNHLDMDSREVLEDALERFEGTIIAVSHDRYFINRIADTLWIVENGVVSVFKGNYDEYLASLKAEEQEIAKVEINKTQAAKQRLKERESRDNDKKKRARVRELEREIELLENRIQELEELFAGGEIYSQQQKLLETQNEYNNIKEKLDKTMEEWMELSE